MKRDLLNAGIPNSAIHLDYAGFRTLDSIIRAKKIFASDDFLIITQRFHCERALYIAEFHDIKANCLAVSGPTNSYGFKVRLREVFARSKAFLDLYILNAQPKFLGPQEPILTSKEIETVTDEMYSDEMDELDAEEIESQENQSDQGIKSDRERDPTQNVDQVLKREPPQQINTEQFFIPESIKRPQP
jgi:SanA protein